MLLFIKFKNIFNLKLIRMVNKTFLQQNYSLILDPRHSDCMARVYTRRMWGQIPFICILRTFLKYFSQKNLKNIGNCIFYYNTK